MSGNGMTPQELEEEMLSNPVQNLQYMLRRLGTRYGFLPLSLIHI